MIFQDRKKAGDMLAQKLEKYKASDSVVYALPRGGVVVGAVIADHLNLPLDVAVIKKIGHPFNPEYAVCAVSANGDMVCDEEAKQSIGEVWYGSAASIGKQEANLRKEIYSKIKPPLSAKGKTAILVDDGIATGLTMKAAIAWIKHQNPNKIIVAVPVISKEIADKLIKEIDELIALEVPEYFLGAVGAYYINFIQISDEEVEELLSKKYDKV